MIITINQILDEFNNFVNNHKQLKDFGYGPTYNIGKTKDMQYPYLWTTHQFSSNIEVNENKTIIPNLSFSIIVMDQINDIKNKDINGQDSHNGQEIMSDNFQILQDFIIYVMTSSFFIKNRIKIEDINIDPLFDADQDLTNGWLMNFNLRMPFINCNIPIK